MRARSSTVPLCTSPVRSSITLVVMPSLVQTQRSPPSTTSASGTRPASSTCLGTVFSAGSMTSQVSRAVSVSRSTSAPAASTRSIAWGVL